MWNLCICLLSHCGGFCASEPRVSSRELLDWWMVFETRDSILVTQDSRLKKNKGAGPKPRSLVRALAQLVNPLSAYLPGVFREATRVTSFSSTFEARSSFSRLPAGSS